MSTSLLYHAFAVKDCDQSAIRFEDGEVVIRINQPLEQTELS